MRNDQDGGSGRVPSSAASGAPRERVYFALCEGCSYTMAEADYVQAEKAVSKDDDPPCPGCGRRAWTFHLAE